MKADISLAERRHIEREQQAEIRAALVRRHFQCTAEQMAIDAALHHLEVEQFRRAAPVINAILARSRSAAVPAPVVMPEAAPAPPPAPKPVAVRASAPDMPFDLRHHLGLQ